MLHNLPHELLPKKWSDYYGHPLAKEFARKFLTEEPRQMIFITGSPGVGKTAFVLLLLKAFRCLNRKPTEIDPCGYCESCLEADIRLSERTLSDVYWLQPGLNTEKTLNAEVKYALEAAEKGQMHSGNQEKDLLWIILDEFHKFPSNVRAQLLSRSEIPNPRTRVCYVFITMQEEALSQTERVAFRRRGSYIRLKPFVEEDIFAYLLKKFPECPPEVAALISKSSDNSIGMAIANYNSILESDPELDVTTAAIVLSFATNKHRLELWEAISNKVKIADLSALLTRIYRYASPQRLALQLIEDIIYSADYLNKGPSQDQLYAIHLLNQYLSNYSSNELLNYLIEIYGVKIVVPEAIEKIEDRMPGYGPEYG